MAGNSFFSRAIGRAVVYGCSEYEDEFVFEKTEDMDGDGYDDLILSEVADPDLNKEGIL